MIRTFPKSGFVIVAVRGTIGKDGPEPLTVLAVKETGLDKVVSRLCQFVVDRGLEWFFFKEHLPLIDVTYHRFRITPPLVFFEDTFFCGLCKGTADRKGLL